MIDGKEIDDLQCRSLDRFALENYSLNNQCSMINKKFTVCKRLLNKRVNRLIRNRT